MRLRRALRRVLGFAPLLAVLVAAPVPAASQTVIESFDVEAAVLPDGTLDVTEVIRPRFAAPRNGIYRTIPVEYQTPQGFNYTLLLDVISITDENNHALKYESSRERHYRKFKIYVPGAAHATRTVNLHYKVLDGLKFFEDHDELYWNVTGDEWELPIESAGARVVLPAGVTGLRATSFTGAYGSRQQDADVQVAGNAVEFRMRRALSFREGLTVVVGWDKGFVSEPAAAAKVALFLRSNWPFSISAGVFVVMFWLWYTRGRDPRLRPIVPQYAPPDGLTPGEAGTLVDNSADMRDITATIVDLAVRGYILIEEKEKPHLMGLWSNKEYAFHLRKKPADWKELKAHERELLEALFAGGATESVELSELQNKFYKNLPAIRDRIFNAHPALSSAASAGLCPRGPWKAPARSKASSASRISSGMWKRTALRAPSRRRRCSRNSCRLLWPWEWRKNGRARSRTSIGSRPSGTAAPTVRTFTPWASSTTWTK